MARGDQEAQPGYAVGYVPIAPRPTRCTQDPLTDQKVRWAGMKHEDLLKHLPLHASSMSVTKLDAKVGASYMLAAVTAEAGFYRVTLDYAKYQVRTVGPDACTSGTPTGTAGVFRVGVGVRVTAILQTVRANLDLGGLGAIGLAVEAGLANGSLQVDIIGVDSKDVTTLIPLPSDIDPSSIIAALQAVATIKAKIHDEATVLRPHVMAMEARTPKSLDDLPGLLSRLLAEDCVQPSDAVSPPRPAPQGLTPPGACAPTERPVPVVRVLPRVR
jgi:hypothetical protein